MTLSRASYYGNVLKRILTVKPDFVRLLGAGFALLVGFKQITVTPEQFALVVAFIESAFQYLSKLAFNRDIDELSAVL